MSSRGELPITALGEPIEPDLVDLARQRLARIGYHPALVATDGAAGLPEHAPFDRIVATCAVPSIPLAWVRQTSPGGVILTDLKPASGRVRRFIAREILAVVNGEGIHGRWPQTAPRYGAAPPGRYRPRQVTGLTLSRRVTADVGGQDLDVGDPGGIDLRRVVGEYHLVAARSTLTAEHLAAYVDT